MQKTVPHLKKIADETLEGGDPSLRFSEVMTSWQKESGIIDGRISPVILDEAVGLHNCGDEQQLLEVVLHCLLARTGATVGSIYIWDEVAKALVLRVARGSNFKRVSQSHIELGKGILGKIAQQGSCVLIKDTCENACFDTVKRSSPYRSPSLIFLSILAGGKLLGAVSLAEKKDLAVFDEHDFYDAKFITKHLAIAYENLKIQRRLRKDNEELTHGITSLKSVLKQQESFVSTGKLAAHLTHELNGPLDGIQRFINLALEQEGEEPRAREYLLKAKGGVRRAIRVIRGFLSFSKQTSAKNGKIVEIHSVLEGSIESAKQNPSFNNVHFECEFEKNHFYVRDISLTTVFRNLFENARYAIADSGKISIQTQGMNGQVMVSIQDTGKGIPQAVQSRIFEPFFTTKSDDQGTGIGLAICRDLLGCIGGRIDCESEEGVGTTFFVKIPAEGTVADSEETDHLE